jgi:anti-anti-sigma factor
MDAPPGSLRVHVDDAALTVQVLGRGTMRLCPALRQLIEQALSSDRARICIDLRHCTFVDSTLVGSLLCILRQASRRPQAHFAVASPSPECRRHLEQVGVADLLPIEEAEELPAAAWQDVPCDLGDVARLKSNVVEAHRALAALPGDSGDQFQRVAACLDAEVQR